MRLTTRMRLVAAVLMMSGVAGAAGAQPRAPLAPAAPPAGAPPQVIAAWGSNAQVDAVGRDQDARVRRDRYEARNREVVRFGGDYELAADGVAREIFMIGGQVKIAGEVTGDVVVLFGTLELTNTAVVRDVAIINSDAVFADGASVRGDLVSVLGHVAAPATFQPGGSHALIDPRVLGPWVDPIIEWFTRGLIWGRLIVPDMSWVWAVAAVFALLTVLIGLLGSGPVSATASVLREKPLSSMLVGLAALILVGPISVLLAISVVGIVVVPFVLLGLVLAGVIGRVAVVRWLGLALLPSADPEDRIVSVRSLGIGIAVLTALYMVPILGLITWASVGVFGLGAAALAFIAGYRRENPAPVRPPRPPNPPGGGRVPMTAPVDTVTPLSFESADLPPPAAAPGGSMAMADPMAIPAGSPSPSQVASADLTLFPRASFKDRMTALVLDFILCLLMWGILMDALDADGPGLLLFVLLAYHVGMVTYKGATVGDIICQLRVIRTDGQRVAFAEALVRGLAALFSAFVLMLGFFAILRDQERQAWHDRVGGTYVVKVPRNWPL